MEAEDYSSKSYWNKRYEDGTIDHEWYYSFDTLRPIIEDCIEWSKDCKVLEVGCGDRPLIDGFASLGISENNLHAIDYSKSVVDALKAQQVAGNKPPGIKYEDMDGCKMSFQDQNFDFVCEKGTMDAILSDKRPHRGIQNGLRLVTEMVRILKAGGVGLIVSHIEVDTPEFEVLIQQILMPALSTRFDVHWKLEAHVVGGGDCDAEGSDCSEREEEEVEKETPKSAGKKRKIEEEEEDEKNEEETEDVSSGYGTVYIFKSFPRKITRYSMPNGDISFEVKSYDV